MPSENASRMKRTANKAKIPQVSVVPFTGPNPEALFAECGKPHRIRAKSTGLSAMEPMPTSKFAQKRFTGGR